LLIDFEVIVEVVFGSTWMILAFFF